MAITYYDQALYEKIQSWFKDKKARVLKVDDTMENIKIRADEGNDEPLKLPFINISRDKRFQILRLGKTPLSCSGRIVAAGKKYILPLNAIPISLSYQIDIYTQRYEEADAYLRELITNLINHPGLAITVPYNDIKFRHNSYIRVMADVVDNSDIPERLFKTQFTRWTIDITIDDAYLFSVPTKEIPTIESIDLKIARQVDGEIIIDETTPLVN